MRYLIKISYDGTNFQGYQRQPGKRCVESYKIKEAIIIARFYKPKKLYNFSKSLSV